MTLEIEQGRQLVVEALERYRDACDLWAQLTVEQQVQAQGYGLKPPTADEVLRCLAVVGKLQAAFGTVQGRDAVAVDAVLQFMGQVRALVSQHLPDEGSQKALISAIQQLDLRT